MITKSVIYTEDTVYKVSIMKSTAKLVLEFRSHDEAMGFIHSVILGGITEIHLSIISEKEDSNEK